MKSLLKNISGRIAYAIGGIIIFLVACLFFAGTCERSSSSYYFERQTNKSLVKYGLVLAVIGIGLFYYAVSKRAKPSPDDTLKLTGNKIDKKPEGLAELENFKIESWGSSGQYKRIKANVKYKGLQQELTVYFANEEDYDKISPTEKITVSGECDDLLPEINNARIIRSGSTIIS